MLEKLYRRYTVTEFFSEFIKENPIIGGLFLPTSKQPEICVVRNIHDNKMYAFENPTLKRRAHVALPVNVFIADEEIKTNKLYREQGIPA